MKTNVKKNYKTSCKARGNSSNQAYAYCLLKLQTKKENYETSCKPTQTSSNQVFQLLKLWTKFCSYHHTFVTNFRKRGYHTISKHLQFHPYLLQLHVLNGGSHFSSLQFFQEGRRKKQKETIFSKLKGIKLPLKVVVEHCQNIEEVSSSQQLGNETHDLGLVFPYTIQTVRTDVQIPFLNGCSDKMSNMRVLERKEFREREKTNTMKDTVSLKVSIPINWLINPRIFMQF